MVNQLPVPTALHWHGIVLPNLMDGVPFVTQLPIPPGGSHDYDFPLEQSGSYWMHSHYGLQEQQLNAAPMIIRSPAQAALADAEFTVMLSDFSFTSPPKILESLMGDMGDKKTKKDEMKPMGSAKAPDGEKKISMGGSMKKVTVQQWDDTSGRFVAREVMAAALDIDVKYDALLANRHSPDDPEVLGVKPGQKVLLRLIAASSATNFFIDTGRLDATVLAVDGEPVQPLHGNFFQLAVAQRLDLLVTIPADGVFPILAFGEGTNLETGVELVTDGVKLPKGAFPSTASAPWAASTTRRSCASSRKIRCRPSRSTARCLRCSVAA